MGQCVWGSPAGRGRGTGEPPVEVPVAHWHNLVPSLGQWHRGNHQNQSLKYTEQASYWSFVVFFFFDHLLLSKRNLTLQRGAFNILNIVSLQPLRMWTSKNMTVALSLQKESALFQVLLVRIYSLLPLIRLLESYRTIVNWLECFIDLRLLKYVATDIYFKSLLPHCKLKTFIWQQTGKLALSFREWSM